METVSLSPLRVASLLWQPRPGAWVLTVACKATYLLHPTESPLAPEQEEPNEEDGYWDDDTNRSLHFATDLSPVKPRAEVTLVGHAFAPGKQPVRSLITRLMVGEVDKSIEVHCDRYFTQDGALHEGPQFARMSLAYERAAGGLESWNPVGVRQGERDMYGKTAVPNLQPVDMLVSTPKDFVEPIGFGPLAPTWPTRRGKLGAYARSFSARDLASKPMPEGIDLGYFNAAPLDQHAHVLRDNERILLENLHPDHPRLVTSLPGVRPRAFVEGRAGGPLSLAMRADTLAIDTERAVCSMTFRGQLPLERPQESWRVLVAMEKGAQSLTWAEVERMARGARDSVAAMRAVSQGGSYKITSAVEAALQTLEGPLNPEGAGPTLPFASAPRHAERPLEAAPGRGLPFAMPAQGAQPPVAQSVSPAPQAAAPAAVSPPPLYIAESIARGGLQVQPPPPVGQVVPPGDAPPVPVAAFASAAVAASPSAVERPPIYRGPGAVDSPWASGSLPPGALDVPGLGVQGGAVVLGTAGSAAAVAPTGSSSAKDDVDGGALLDASSAAAAQSPQRESPRAGAGKEGAAEPAQAAARSEALPEAKDVVELIWFDRDAMPRIRKKPAWREIILGLENRPPDTELDDLTLGKTPAEVEDKRDIFEVLAHGRAIDEPGIHEALRRAIRTDGKLVPPLELVAGELVFPFDELESLRTHVAVATPFSAGDERLRAALATAREFLGVPDLASSPAVSEALTKQIRDAFAQAKRIVGADYLQAQTEWVLLEKRRYQRREVFGEVCIRCLLHAGGSSSPIPVYLPDGIARRLPMYQRFRAKMIADIHFGVDQYEAHSEALRVVGFSRIIDLIKSVFN